MLIDWKTCSYNNLWEFSSAITYQLYTWEQTYKHVKMSNCYRPCKQVSTSLSIKPISGCVSTACSQLLDKSGTIKLSQSCITSSKVDNNNRCYDLSQQQVWYRLHATNSGYIPSCLFVSVLQLVHRLATSLLRTKNAYYNHS